MRLYQWDNQAMDKPPLLYEDDDPNGGTIVLCSCGKTFNTKGRDTCPHCGADMVFGRFDW